MNLRESIVADKYSGDGWEVLSNGWPDFLFYKEETNEAMFVEVKSKPTKYEVRHKKPMGGLPTPNQERMHKVLRDLGLSVKVVHVK